MTANPALMGIRELGDSLCVAPQTIRGNRDHPLYSRALKLGGPTSPLKWRRVDVAEFLGVDVATLHQSSVSSVDKSEALDRREAELAARERRLNWAIGEIKAVLAVLEHGKRFPVAHAADGLTPRSR